MVPVDEDPSWLREERDRVYSFPSSSPQFPFVWPFIQASGFYFC